METPKNLNSPATIQVGGSAALHYAEKYGAKLRKWDRDKREWVEYTFDEVMAMLPPTTQADFLPALDRLHLHAYIDTREVLDAQVREQLIEQLVVDHADLIRKETWVRPINMGWVGHIEPDGPASVDVVILTPGWRIDIDSQPLTPEVAERLAAQTTFCARVTLLSGGEDNVASDWTVVYGLDNLAGFVMGAWAAFVAEQEQARHADRPDDYDPHQHQFED